MKAHVFACGGLKPPPQWSRIARRHALDNGTADATVTNFQLELPGPLLSSLSPRMSDLVRIASYCYLADQSASRGGETDMYLQDWRRQMHLAIPVSEPDFWNSRDAMSALCETLNFVTEDGWAFHFDRLKGPGTGQMGLIETSSEQFGEPGCVLLYSGGADSLCAILAAHGEGANPFLVSHRASKAAVGHRRDLLTAVRARFGPQAFRTAEAVVSLRGGDANETTQRSRSMLYASLGSAVASALGIEDVRLADNGIVSVNLPFTDQALGARASRSTHPTFLRLFQRLARLATENGSMRISNPLWNRTRAETFDLLRPFDALNLVQLTHSCAHPRGQTKAQPHCGCCSQCVDRRFGTLAAGIEAYDLSEAYKVDIFTGHLEEGEPRTIATTYLRHAMRMEPLTDDQMLLEFPQLSDCLDPSSPTVADDGLELIRMHQRHAKAVLSVVEGQIEAHKSELARGLLPATCLITLAAGTGEGQTASRGRRQGLVHGEYYESVVFEGRSHALTPNQGKVLRVLNEAWEVNEPPLSWRAIKERSGVEARNMSDVFAGSRLWNTLIVQAGARGVYALAIH